MSTLVDEHVRETAIGHAGSFIVQAPAGSGKTTLLVRRYLNLLTRVDQPEEILAITFTRKAATQMRDRILDQLRDGNSIESEQARTRNRVKGWGLDKNPSRLRIQTIDSFIMGLLRVLPLTSGFNRNALIPEDMRSVYRAAVEQVLHQLFDDHPLNVYVADFLALFANDAARASDHLIEMLAHRDQWLMLTTQVLKQATSDRSTLNLSIAQGVQHMHRTLTAEVEHSFDPEQKRLVAHLTQRLWPGQNASLQQLAGVLTTVNGRLRKRLTVREGFGPDRKDDKAIAQALIQSLMDADMETMFANLRFLPDELLKPEELDTLATVGVTLTLAALALAEQFQRNGETDFVELLLAAQRALGEEQAPSDLALIFDYRMQHILLDEFQDTSTSQFALFEMLVRGWSPEDGRTFFAVGDPMQSIYRFRDADVGLFYRAQKQGINDVPLSTVALQTNFRSSAELVTWLNATFASVMGHHDNPHLGKVRYHPATFIRDASGSAADGVAVRLTQGIAAEISAIIRDLQRLRQEHPDHSVGILVRSRTHLSELIAALKTTDLEWQASDIDPLAQTPPVMDLVSLLTAFSDRRDRLAWFALLRAPFVGCDLKDLEIFSQTAQFSNASITDRLDQLSVDGQQRVARLLQVLGEHEAHRYTASARSLIESMWLKLGGAVAYRDPASSAYADQFFALIDQSGIQGLLPERVRALLDTLFAESGQRKNIQIMTIHKAKGLEFDHVFLPFLDRETATTIPPLLHWRFFDGHLLIAAKGSGTLYNWLNREARQQEQHELQRLLYVACSRAKKSLTLSASTTDVGANASFQPHPLTLAALVSEHFRLSGSDNVPTAPANTGIAERLPADYRWSPPPERVIAPFLTDTVMVEVVEPTRLLRLLAQVADLDGDSRAKLFAGNRDTDEREMLERILADEHGQWILQQRASAQNNVVLNVRSDTHTINQILLERTFIDDSQRWVIHYVFTCVSQPQNEEFIEGYIRSEASRWVTIRDAAQSFYGATIKVGVYFSTLSRFVEIPAGA
ncbi:MAG: UvrD-helicase domain-containing protein [Proteobacteria bacterium]|nr:UvrD-helicase domain-containing protein [Pseudomonadota bacterium]